MRIQFFDKNARITDKAMTVRNTPHGDNLAFLARNQNMWDEINEAIEPIADAFLQRYQTVGDSYLNSGNVAQRVCASLNYPQDQFHHGLVGSALLEYLEKLDSLEIGLPPDITLIASRGEDETWIHYFFPRQPRSL